jgi:hypothetical protein
MVLFETLLVEKFDISLVDAAAEALFPLICLHQVCPGRASASPIIIYCTCNPSSEMCNS